jgi:hypothetical protein
VIDPDFAWYVARSTEAIPSSGYFAIFLAAQMCAKVYICCFYQIYS